MDVIKILCTDEIKRFGQNNYLIKNNDTAILIDASAEVQAIKENLNMFNPVPKLQAIFITHAHFDHIMRLNELIKEFDCPVYVNKFGKEILPSPEKNLSYIINKEFGVKDKKHLHLFKDGEEICVGDIKVKCFLTPGHSLDSSVFVIDDNMFTGDTVFKSAIGRTDLIGGSSDVIKISLLRIKNKLSQDINNFYAGHGENFDKNTLDSVIDYYIWLLKNHLQTTLFLSKKRVDKGE